MINYREIEKLIVNGLQDYLTSQGYNCPVIMANQTSPIPEYPYISYTITSPVISDAKTYGVTNDGTRFKSMVQIWSFTVQSGDDTETANIALAAYDWFALVGSTYLSDNKIVAQRVGSITNRDNLLSIEYEYRQGFDVQFLLPHVIDGSALQSAGYITSTTISVTNETTGEDIDIDIDLNNS